MPVLKKVAGLIPRMKTGPITVFRSLKPTKNEYFEWVHPAPQIFILKPVVVYQTSGKDLEQLPEGNKNRGSITIESLRRLYTADSDANFEVDRVLYQGLKYKIIQAQDYLLQGGVYISIAVLEEPTQ